MPAPLIAVAGKALAGKAATGATLKTAVTTAGKGMAKDAAMKSITSLGNGNSPKKGGSPGGGPTVKPSMGGKLKGDLNGIANEAVRGIFGAPNANSLEQASNKKELGNMMSEGKGLMKALKGGDLTKAFSAGASFAKSIQSFKGAESATMAANAFKPTVGPKI